MTRETIAAAALGLLVALPATADEITPASFTSETFSTPGQTVTARVQLAGGQWYALGVPTTGDDSEGLTATVTAPSHRVLATVNGEPVDDAGAGFRAPKAGTYTLAFTDAGSAAAYPWSFQWRILADCPDSPATPCTLKLGKVQTRWLAWAGDADRLSAQLAGGERYTAHVADGVTKDGSYGVLVLDKRGNQLASGFGPGDYAFTAPVGGRAWVRVEAGDDRAWQYTVGITQP
jgi:hypothetical protein